MKQIKTGFDYVMQIRRRINGQGIEPHRGSTLSRKQQLRDFMLRGKESETADMLGQDPSLISAFAETLAEKHPVIDSKRGVFMWSAIEALADAAKKGDDAVQILAESLAHEYLEVQSISAQALKMASENGADILFAVKALQRALQHPAIEDYATMALTHHYIRREQKKEIFELLRDKASIVRSSASKILSLKAGQMNEFALEILIEGWKERNDDARRECAKESAVVFFHGDEETRERMRAELKKFKKQGRVHLDVVREITDVEDVVRSQGRNQS